MGGIKSKYYGISNISLINHKLINELPHDLDYILGILKSDHDIEVAIMINKFPIEYDGYKILDSVKSQDSLFEIYNYSTIPRNVLISLYERKRLPILKLIISQHSNSNGYWDLCKEEYESFDKELIDKIQDQNEILGEILYLYGELFKNSHTISNHY